MPECSPGKECRQAQLPVRENGKIYFSKEAERKFYFILAVIMLVTGILYKTGLF